MIGRKKGVRMPNSASSQPIILDLDHVRRRKISQQWLGQRLAHDNAADIR